MLNLFGFMDCFQHSVFEHFEMSRLMRRICYCCKQIQLGLKPRNF